MKRIHRHFVLAVCVFLVAGAGFVLRAELGPFWFSTDLSAERFAALEDATMPAALSVTSNRRVMLACLDAMTGLYGRAQPSSRRKAVARSCERTAHAVLRDNPASGLAWLASAGAAHILDMPDTFVRRLENARKVTANEQWLAQARLRLPGRLSAGETAEDAGSDADIAVLAQASSGREYLAGRYVRDPQFAERLMRAVEVLDEGTQRRVVAAIRAAVRRAGGS